jgi:hypothetical protein
VDGTTRGSSQGSPGWSPCPLFSRMGLNRPSCHLALLKMLLDTLAADAEASPRVRLQAFDVYVVSTSLTDTEIAVTNALQSGADFQLQAMITSLHAEGPFAGCPCGGQVDFVLGVRVVTMTVRT